MKKIKIHEFTIHIWMNYNQKDFRKNKDGKAAYIFACTNNENIVCSPKQVFSEALLKLDEDAYHELLDMPSSEREEKAKRYILDLSNKKKQNKPFIYAIHDETLNKWILGNKKSSSEMISKYLPEKEFINWISDISAQCEEYVAKETSRKRWNNRTWIARLIVKLIAPRIHLKKTDNYGTSFEWSTNTIYYDREADPFDIGFARHVKERHKFPFPENYSTALWSILHEIGHYETDYAEEDLRAKAVCRFLPADIAYANKGIQNLYYDSPDEFEATEWAIEWIEDHPKLAKLFSKVL